MLSSLKKCLAVSFTTAALLQMPTAQAESYEMTVAGASPGGLWSLLGAGLDSSVRAAYPDSKITYQTSGGGIANIGQLDRNQTDLAIVHDAELLLAKKGESPFREPIDSIRVLSYLYTWAPMQALVMSNDPILLFAKKRRLTIQNQIIKAKVHYKNLIYQLLDLYFQLILMIILSA